MSWNYEDSKRRVEGSIIADEEITVKRLSRRMDIDNVTLTNCRIVYGSHLYTDISNFTKLMSDTTLAADSYKRLTRCLHVYQREVARIVEQVYDGVKIHFQGSRLHGLFYYPINEGNEVAKKAALCALTLELLTRGPLSKVFPDYKDFRIASGMDVGDAVVTKNGTGGDRELLFLGDAANQAAKIIGAGYSINATKNLRDLLSEELCGFIDKSSRTITELRDALETYDVDWDEETAQERMELDVCSVPLKDIEFSSAEADIDKSRLSIRNNKRIFGASVFADVAGFTKHVSSAESEEDFKELIRTFHMVRKEMREVVVKDFGGMRVQYQGDRVQGLFYLPKDDEDAIANKAVKAAIGLQSSMEHVLNPLLPDDADLHLAIGISIGTTLLSSLGARGQRDIICIGDSVAQAANLEEASGRRDTCISRDAYEHLHNDLQPYFKYSATLDAYAAHGLTQQQLDYTAQAAVYESGRVSVQTTTRGAKITSATQSQTQHPGARVTKPTSTWCEGKDTALV